MTNPSTVIHVARMGGAVARVPADATAFGNRTAPYICWILGLWAKDPARTEEHRTWVREIAKAVEVDAAEGVYINVISDDEENGAADAYGTVVYDWLTRVKTKYDPTNVFRSNHNIKPKVNSEWYFESPARLALSRSIAQAVRGSEGLAPDRPRQSVFDTKARPGQIRPGALSFAGYSSLNVPKRLLSDSARVGWAKTPSRSAV